MGTTALRLQQYTHTLLLVKNTVLLRMDLKRWVVSCNELEPGMSGRQLYWPG
jgi:hypothetical protein